MLRNLLNRTAAEFDLAASRALFHRSARSLARSRTESLSPAERLQALGPIVDLYARPEHLHPGAPFHPEPPAIVPRAERVRALRGGEVVDWRWPSDFAPLSPDVADRYVGFAENRLAGARLHLHADRPRPVAILLHGYRAGQYAVEERVWPLSWLFESGLDVAIPALPFHGVRAPRLASAIFPGSDPRITNEGFRQAAKDLRGLIRHLRERGAPHVGLMGMSLGGYTTALLTTLEPGLSFAVPMIPLASLAHMARSLGRLTGTPDEQRAQFEALDAAHRPVSPLARPPLIEKDRILITAAEGDRITPLEHARALAEHLGAPLHLVQGGHILQFGRADAFRAVGRLLWRLGIFGR
jgi:dienelactone hydrolase